MDNMDYATSNLMGAMAAVVAAFILTFVLIETRKTYYGRLLHRNMGKAPSCFGKCCYGFISCCVHVCDCLKIERTSEKKKIQMGRKLKARLDELDKISDWETADTSNIELEEEEERVLVETLVSAEDPNIWALLMPAAYMLVPGSMIAKMWFNTIFPPINAINIFEVNSTITEVEYIQQFDNVFSNLMVISTSLALGLILGFAVVQLGYKLISSICACSKVRVKSSRSYLPPIARYPPTHRLPA